MRAIAEHRVLKVEARAIIAITMTDPRAFDANKVQKWKFAAKILID